MAAMWLHACMHGHIDIGRAGRHEEEGRQAGFRMAAAIAGARERGAIAFPHFSGQRRKAAARKKAARPDSEWRPRLRERGSAEQSPFLTSQGSVAKRPQGRRPIGRIPNGGRDCVSAEQSPFRRHKRPGGRHTVLERDEESWLWESG